MLPTKRCVLGAKAAFIGSKCLLLGALLTQIGWAAEISPLDDSRTDFAPPPVDAAFTRGLARVKQISGLQEANPGMVLPEWTPGLCMLIGFRTDHGTKQFVHLVEVTTLQPIRSDSNGRSAPLPTEKQSMTFAWTNRFLQEPRTHTFFSPKHPVRVRLFDENGRFLKESREHLPWRFLTNGLVDVCESVREMTRSGSILTNRSISPLSAAAVGQISNLLTATEVRIARGGLALGGLFAVIGDTEALKEVRAHATAVIRPPNFLKALFEMKLDLQLDPKFDQAVELPKRGDTPSSRQLLFPLSLRQGQRILTRVDFIAGSTDGAYFLSSGVRALRATHPAKSDRSMLAQVLAVGIVAEQATDTEPGDAQ